MQRAMILLAACLTATVVPCGAAQHVVQPDGLGDYPTIQAAVNAAAAGDTLDLTDGTFTGDGNRDISFGGKDLVVRSQSDNAALSIIDCGGSVGEPHRGFVFETGESRASQLIAITIRNAYAASTPTQGGGGIRVSGTFPTFVRCVISHCEAAGSGATGGGICSVGGGHPLLDSCIISDCVGGSYGGGIAVTSADITLESCTVMYNTADGTGGGMYVQGADNSMVQDCVFAQNTADTGGGIRIGGDLVLVNCLIRDNAADPDFPGEGGGGALLMSGGLENCTVVANSSTGAGGGVLCMFGTTVTLTNCIVAGNTDGSGVACYRPEDAMSLACCDVWGNTGGDYGANITDQTGVSGNISDDPLFCNAPMADYSIDAASPCAPAHNACGVYMGSQTIGCDSPVEATSWGAVKAFFRQ